MAFTIADFLTTGEQAEIQDIVAKVTSDAQLGAVSVTYRRLAITGGGSATYNPAAGTITDPYSGTTVTGILCAVREADAKVAGTELAATDRKFLVDRDALAADPVANDVILYGSTAYEVLYVKYVACTKLCVLYLKQQGGRA